MTKYTIGVDGISNYAWCGPYLGFSIIQESWVIYESKMVASIAKESIEKALKSDWPNARDLKVCMVNFK